MKSIAILIAILFAAMLSGQNSVKADDPAIRQVIKDYIEGYYSANPDRVKGALHSELAKRFVAKTKEGKQILKSETAAHMVELTASNDGPKYYKPGHQRLEIKIFEIDKDIASAKAVAEDWVDYIHLARIDGKWQIVNVIWTSTPAPTK